jgi:Arc/MetJ family transcription regulator
MRTTIRIDDALYRRVKELAAHSGRTVAAVLEDAVRAGLATREASADEVRALPTHGRGGTLPGVDLSSNAALQEAMDGEARLDALR